MAGSTQIRFPFLKEALELFDEKHVLSAQRRAVTAVKGKVRTAISRAARARFRIAARRIARDLRITTSDQGKLRSATLTYSGERISLVHFGARFRKIRTVGRRGHLAGSRLRRLGASAKVSKSSRPYVVPGGFIAAGESGNVHVFQRTRKNVSTSRLRIMTGPAAAQMVGHPDVVRDYEGIVNREYPRIFESKLNHLLEQASR